MQDSSTHGNYGNLMSYKFYIRPAAQKQYGYFANVKTKHQKNIHGVLRLLAFHGACTTWDMAKVRLRDVPKIRAKEREYRRFFIGRYDRRRYAPGILDLGLVVREQKMIGKKMSWKYRLSLHGILYLLDVLEPENKEIDRMAATYAASLPKIFGRWDHLKSILGDEVYKMRVLAKALFLDNTEPHEPNNPIRELMSYIHVKYQKNYDVISEHDLAEQISCWFYTYMLYHGHSRMASRRRRAIKTMFRQESQMYGWYVDFFREAREHYRKRLKTMNLGVWT